jgi:hypothetical protein
MDNANQPANPGFSDEEFLRNLRTLKRWTLIDTLRIPVCLIGAFAGAAFFSNYDMMGAAGASFVIALILCIVLYFEARKQVSKLKSMMGDGITLPLLREAFEIRKYEPNGHISENLVRSSYLVIGWHRISGSDFVEGSYKGVNILYSDVQLEREDSETDEDGHQTTTYVTLFNGQWLICDLGKELAASLKLIERKGGTKSNRVYDSSKSSIETESAAFNKKFRIETDDGHSAFYLLTPHFMERLTAADEAADSSTMFCFMDGKVHIALFSGRNSFDLKGIKLDSLDSVRQKFRKDLKYITDILDELLQNDKLFKEA